MQLNNARGRKYCVSNAIENLYFLEAENQSIKFYCRRNHTTDIVYFAKMWKIINLAKFDLHKVRNI